jgi:6-phosphogluconolactonase (cycloisomerase 2 family)
VKVLTRLIAPAAAAVAVAALAATPALAAPARVSVSSPASAQCGCTGASDAVFVQTNNTAGNAVVAYHRAPDGGLTLARTYPTGGLGGMLGGSVVDHLASQGSLGYDPKQGLLFAVNAGSDTVSVFSVSRDRLLLRQVVWSGGTFPVSVTVHGNDVYVLNALRGGSVYGYRVYGGRLFPIPGSRRALGLNPTATPQFTNTPGQVSFTPDGSKLLVTTKANGDNVDVFFVRGDGRLSFFPVVNHEPDTVPFGLTYDRYGHVVLAESGPNAVATFVLLRNGVLVPLHVALTGQSATCWVTRAGRYFYASNAGSASVSGYAIGRGGQLFALGNTTTNAGTVDSAATANGRFLYVQTGAAGIVDEFAVRGNGSLAEIGSVTVAGAVGGQGIVAF